MLAAAYGTTVAVFMINSCITILRCIVANKSTASRQRQCHDECVGIFFPIFVGNLSFDRNCPKLYCSNRQIYAESLGLRG
jgi:hypothetical protein